MTTDPKKSTSCSRYLKKQLESLQNILIMKNQEIYDIINDGQEKDRFQVEFGQLGEILRFDTKKKIEELKLPWYYLYTKI